MATAEAPTILYTPDDLLRLDDVQFELVDGRLVERKMSFLSSAVGMRLGRFLDHHCDLHALGWVAGADCGYRCFPHDPGRVRRPDVSFVALGRFPGGRPPEGFVAIPPDLAVEVLSPNDLDYETDEKVEEYLRAGVRLVWVVSPVVRTVLIYRADGSILGLREAGELSGEEVVPGFLCRVSDLFAIAGAAPAGGA